MQRAAAWHRVDAEARPEHVGERDRALLQALLARLLRGAFVRGAAQERALPGRHLSRHDIGHPRAHRRGVASRFAPLLAFGRLYSLRCSHSCPRSRSRQHLCAGKDADPVLMSMKPDGNKAAAPRPIPTALKTPLKKADTTPAAAASASASAARPAPSSLASSQQRSSAQGSGSAVSFRFLLLSVLCCTVARRLSSFLFLLRSLLLTSDYYCTRRSRV